MSYSSRGRRRFGIGSQLMVAVVSLSLIFTIIIAAYSVSRELDEELSHIDAELQQIEDSYLSSFTASLWVEDRELLMTQVQGMARLPGVDYIQIVSSDEVIIEIGTRLNGDVVERRWPMEFDTGSKRFELAELIVQSDLTAIYQGVWQQFLFLIGAEAIKIFLLMLAVLAVTFRLMVNPLKLLAGAVSDFKGGHVPSTVTLPERWFVDEVGVLAEKYNQSVARVREHHDELEQERDKAQVANRKKGEFLATMSHEIRTPMNGIMGVASLLSETELDDQQKEYVAIINTSSGSLMTIINDILDFSKIEAGKIDLEHCPFHLLQMLDQVASLHTVKAHEKHLQLVCQIDPKLPTTVTGDVVRVQQVLNNLLSNAIKFTERGHVKLAVSLQSSAEREVTVHFQVTDTGIGIAKEHQQAIFERFQQADGSTTRKYGGTGLGLAISTQLVTLMGGELHLTSALGLGSSFEFIVSFATAGEMASPSTPSNVLDIRHPEPTATDEVVAETEVDASQLSVLVVEDTIVNQKVVKFMLEKLSIRVSIAEHGEVALRMCAEDSFDLILMDLQMPVMDGFIATEHIRQMGDWGAKVPIIAVSANVIREDQERCFEVGMNEFVPKPIDKQRLREVIEQYAPGKLNLEPQKAT